MKHKSLQTKCLKHMKQTLLWQTTGVKSILKMLETAGKKMENAKYFI